MVRKDAESEPTTGGPAPAEPTTGRFLAPVELVPPPRRSPSSRPPRDPRSDGERSTDTERVFASLDALRASLPEPPPPDREERMATLAHELACCAPETDGPVSRRVLALGPDILPALAKVFPGVLWVDLARPHRPLRGARALSAAARALVAFGEPAVPYVAALLRSPRPEVRVAASLVAADLANGALVRPLTARLFDEVRAVRNAATIALWASVDLPESAAMRMELMSTLADAERPRDWRRRAAWTLGQLRDEAMVPALIDALADEAEVAETARAALVRISGVDRGRFRYRWRRWWGQSRGQDRTTWLLDALEQSDAEARIRVMDELVLATGEGFDRRAAVETREGAREVAAFLRAKLARPSR